MSLKVVHGLNNIGKSKKHGSVVTIGVFDGVHGGHQAILNRLRESEQSEDLESVVLTFLNHPLELLVPDKAPRLLTSPTEKENFMGDSVSGRMIVIEFTETVKNLTHEDFAREILVAQLKTKRLIVGFNHFIGRNRGGTIPEMQRLGREFGFEVEVVEPVLFSGKPISSSRIRSSLMDGHLEDALTMLGHPYAITGAVERGIGMGRKLGYPTANVRCHDRKLLPKEGVYACKALVEGEEKHGMLFIGQNHLNPVSGVTVEANLFDFDKDIYYSIITVCPMYYIRESRKFESTEALIAQIELDKKHVLEIISKGETTCQ
ncbi:MAG: bifunctional riboflavin kinase/FAD synthetase [candidate division Zixibacteria bacterium]|nr:bifunctional riboflavin kinase/FAD synthetase [candidate division Zixibacteria bacterium]